MALLELPTVRPILVVDDNEDGRLGLAEFLRLKHFTVAEASNGRDALKLARALEPSLILLDLMMPGVSGYEVLEVLRASPTLVNIPVVVTSDFDDRLPPGAIGALQKPLRLDLVEQYAEAYATRALRFPLPLTEVVA